jgi:hypothetical protein
MPIPKKTATLIKKIEQTGRSALSYSGRFMYGKECVAVKLYRGDSGTDLPKAGQCRDSLGLSQIVYWPAVEWPNIEIEN